MTYVSSCNCSTCKSYETEKAATQPSLPTLPYACTIHSGWKADYCYACTTETMLFLLSQPAPDLPTLSYSDQFQVQGAIKLAVRQMSKYDTFEGSWAQGLIETLYADWDRSSAILPHDLHCAECDLYVSNTLPSDSDHWDLICGDCQNHEDGSNCDKCRKCGYHTDSYGNCSCCADCGSPYGYCECCEYCSNAPSECSCEECEDCGATNSSYCGCGNEPYRFGTTKAVTWDELPDSTPRTEISQMSDIDSNVDPVRAAADFYLLDSMVNVVRFGQISGGRDGFAMDKDRLVGSDQMLPAYIIGAKRTFESLVDRLDRTFLSYAINAVGGELRYHRACSAGWAPMSRRESWKAFVEIVNNKGVQPVYDAVDLFEEFGSGSYGGTKWAQIAKVAAQRLSGSMPAWLFVDRIFTLEHNGGCCLNKNSWATSNQLGYGLHHMRKVLDAHAAEQTNWDLLLKVATPEVADMWRKMDRRVNTIARRVGGELPAVIPSGARRVNQSGPCNWCGYYACVC